MEKSDVFNIIDEYMQTHQSVSVISQVQEFDLRERIVRVEEGLKHLGVSIEYLAKRIDRQQTDIKMLSKHLFQFMIFFFGVFTASAAGVIIAVLK
jgi:hypothetical protein